MIAAKRTAAALFGLGVILAVITCVRKPWAIFGASVISYYAMWVILVGWCALMVCYARRPGAPSIRGRLRRDARPILFCLALSALLFATVPPAFRVLNDETTLLSISRNMALNQRTEEIREATWQSGSLEPVLTVIDKRPLMFPFITHLFHLVFGFRTANVFAVNFLVLAAVFFGIYRLFESRGWMWACTAVVAAAAQPIVPLSAASGGFELLSVLLLLCAFRFLWLFLRAPDTRLLTMLWSTLIVLSHVRYESGMILVLTAFSLLAFGYGRLCAARWMWLAALSPFLLMPLIWQRWVTTAFYANEWNRFFSFRYFLESNWIALKNLFDFGFYLPINNALNLIALLMTPAILFAACRKTGSAPERRLVVIAVLWMAALWILFTSYRSIPMNHPWTARYFLWSSVACSLVAVHGLSRSGLRASRAMAAVLILFLIYHPVAVRHAFFTNINSLVKLHSQTAGFFQARQKDDFLIVSNRPRVFAAEGYAAISFARAKLRPAPLMAWLKESPARDIFVIQIIHARSKRPASDQDPGPAYRLRPVLHKPFGKKFIRISKVL